MKGRRSSHRHHGAGLSDDVRADAAGVWTGWRTGQVLAVRLRGAEPRRNVPATAEAQGHAVLSVTDERRTGRRWCLSARGGRARQHGAENEGVLAAGVVAAALSHGLETRLPRTGRGRAGCRSRPPAPSRWRRGRGIAAWRCCSRRRPQAAAAGGCGPRRGSGSRPRPGPRGSRMRPPAGVDPAEGAGEGELLWRGRRRSSGIRG